MPVPIRSGRERWHRGVRWVLLGLCVFFAVHGVHAGLRPEGSDFTIYYRAGCAVLEGRDPCEVERYRYLPAFAVGIAPLALLPYTLALVGWQAASFAALVVIERASRKLCARELGARAPWLEWAPLACTLRLVDSNLANGQANLLVLAPVVLALEAWTRGRERRAGALLGGATALKLVPGFLVVLFAARREGRALRAAVATTLALVLVLPTAVLGWRTNLAGVENWYRGELAPYLRGGAELAAQPDLVAGQSLTASAYRLLSADSADSAHANVAELSPAVVNVLVRIASAGVLVLVVVSLIRSARRATRGARLREAALALCAAPLLAPLTHKAHMVWLLLPYAVLLSGAPRELGRAARGLRWALAGASVFLIGGTTPALLGRAWATAALERNAVCFGAACVLAALLVDVWGARGEEARATIASDRAERRSSSLLLPLTRAGTRAAAAARSPEPAHAAPDRRAAR